MASECWGRRSSCKRDLPGSGRGDQLQENDSAYFEDSSLVYVRDRHGVLYSPPGYEQCKANPLSPDPLQVVHGALCAVKTNLNHTSPCKLYQICKNFVANNLHLLESLVDFPESIGHDIFEEAVQMKVFSHNPQYLSLFCAAYNSLVLETLSLRQSTAVINEYTHVFKYFDNLTQLDLAHCQLGDEHDYLKWIGKMSSLEYVCLKDNCLTDTGILLWSLPHRMFKSGPGLLRTLDLSCNPGITDACAKCFVTFLHLKSLNLSGTAITITSGIMKIMNQTSLKLVSYVPDFSKTEFTTTKGWALPVISELISASGTRNVKPGNSHPPGKIKSFYQSTVRITEKVGMTDERKIMFNNSSYPTMLLLSEELVLPDTLRNIDSSLLGKQDKKRRRANEITVNSFCKKQKVSKCQDLVTNDIGNLEDDSDSLLDSYLKYL